MCPKELICKTLPYYHGKREEHWINIFKNKIDNNEKIDEILQNENRQKARKQAASTLITHYTNLLLYSVANKKTISANSIFNCINWNNNEMFMKYFFSVCGTYFASDKYKGDAYRIVTFLREKNILKDFLKEYLNDKIVEKLSSKNEETNQYLYDNEVIFSTLVKNIKQMKENL